MQSRTMASSLRQQRAARVRCGSGLALARQGLGARCRQPQPCTRDRDHPNAPATAKLFTHASKAARLDEQRGPNPEPRAAAAALTSFAVFFQWGQPGESPLTQVQDSASFSSASSVARAGSYS
jgi:hypothetical protein